MNLEIINTVLIVARLKSFSAAAFAVPCAQSSVSRRVEAAEAELGVKIFVRPTAGESKEVMLTPVGEEIVRAMVKIVDAYAELFRMSDISSDTSGTILLNIGMRRNIMAPMGMSLMKADFFEEHPNICVATRTDEFGVLLSEFRMRRLDALLFSCANLDAERFRTIDDEIISFLGTSGFSVGMSASNTLSKRESVHMNDLRDELFLINIEPSDTVEGVVFSNQRRLRASCLMAGFEPKTRSFPNNMLEIRYKLAIEGKGVFPSHTPKKWRRMDGLRYVQVEGADLPVHYYLIHLAGRKEKELKTFSSFFSAHLVD